MSDQASEQVVKSGEQLLWVELQRTKEGVKFSAKAHPSIEELLRSWGSGEVQPVINHGRHWYSNEREPLKGVYHLGSNPGVCPFDGGHYRVDRAGHPLLDTDGSINLAFLRCAGISEGAGITFNLKGVHELDKLRDIAEKIKLAARRLYVNYMKPVNISIMISTQEMKG